jgi:hypothetical protein
MYRNYFNIKNPKINISWITSEIAKNEVFQKLMEEML